MIYTLIISRIIIVRILKKLDKKTIKKEKEVKTRQNELLEMYPNADLYYDGVIDLKPCRMYTTMLHRGGKCEQYNDCNKCRHDFWMAQLKKAGDALCMQNMVLTIH